MPLLLDSAALSLSSTQNNPASSPTRRVKKQSTQRHESRSQERIRGGISRTLTGESTNSGEKRGNLHPPPPTRRRRSSSRPRKVVVRKKSPETREGGKISTSSSSKSVDAIMKRITISPPLKDPHKDAVEKQLVIRDVLLSQQLHVLHHKALNGVNQDNHHQTPPLNSSSSYVIYQVYSFLYK